MLITPLKTRLLRPPHDNLLSAIQEILPALPKNSILAITSKVISIHQGRCVKASTRSAEDSLAIREATRFIPRGTLKGRPVLHTITHGILMPSAGIDSMNGYSILWPKNPAKTAQTLWKWGTKTYGVKHLGILIVDSHSIPLRRGTVGISLAHYGFTPLRTYQGRRSLFGYSLGNDKVANITDGLAAAATLAMGEGGEQTPLAVIRDVPGIIFTTKKTKGIPALEVPLNDDIYAPLFQDLPWQKNGTL